MKTMIQKGKENFNVYVTNFIESKNVSTFNNKRYLQGIRRTVNF